jgi:hypothetical protein
VALDNNIVVERLFTDAKQGDTAAQFTLAERFRSRASIDIDENRRSCATSVRLNPVTWKRNTGSRTAIRRGAA